MRADALQLDILRELREAAGLTQDDMARLCGLQGQMRRQTAGAWERGDIIPARARRRKVIGYLWDDLHLRRDATRFEAVWEILMREWGWEPISDQEWTSFTQVERPARNDDVEEKLAALSATVEQLQSTANAPATSQPPPAPQLELPLDTLPAPAPLPAGSRMPLGRNPLFVGRESALLALAAAFDMGNTTAISQVETAAATGMGGIGKTQLASEFVHRYGQFFSGGVFWLSFDNAEAIASEFAACGGAGVLDLRPDFSTRPLEEQVRLVQAAFQAASPRLLVFDNCEDPALIVRWRPTSGGSRVLVTSRRGDWEPMLNVHLLTLAVFSRAESINLLRFHCPQGNDRELDLISAELGDLPLALHLAGSYLYRYRRVITPAQYLAYLRDPSLLRHPSLMGSGISPTAHVQHVGRTFALSYERLLPQDECDELAKRLLMLLANFAPGEPVWYDVLVQALELDPSLTEDAVRVDDAFARLIELGLLQISENREMRIHRLVAAFSQDIDPAAAAEGRQNIETTIHTLLQRANDENAPLTLLSGNVHLRYVTDGALQRDVIWGANLAMAFGRHLWQMGDFASSKEYLEQALTIRRAELGEKHKATAQSYAELGYVLREMHHFADAHGHLERAVYLFEQLDEVDASDISEVLNELGLLYAFESKHDMALATLERAYSICLQELGEQHVRTAEVANNLGLMWIDSLENPQKALFFFEQALEIRLQKLGDMHPYTALSHHNVGYVMSALGDDYAAKAAYERALAINIAVLTEEHVTTLLTQSMLGALLTRMGEISSARDYLERAADISLRKLGDAHLMTAVSSTHLALNYQHMGEFTKAQICLRRALAVREKVYDEENLSIAETLELLGKLAFEQGEVHEAQRQLQRALAIRQRFLASDHPLVQDLQGLVDQVIPTS